MIVRWLYPQWVGAAACGAALLLLLTPLLARCWDAAMLITFVQLPVYMLHQCEEHDRDRFRQFVNRMFGGVEALDRAAVLAINIPGVWGLALASLYAAAAWRPGWGLAIVYLVFVNAIVHIIGAIAKRGYNPGLWTGIVLFLPASITAFWIIDSQPGVTLTQHIVGLTVSLLIHAVIVIYTKNRAAHPLNTATVKDGD